MFESILTLSFIFISIYLGIIFIELIFIKFAIEKVLKIKTGFKNIFKIWIIVVFLQLMLGLVIYLLESILI